jgi:hypothetical protein
MVVSTVARKYSQLWKTPDFREVTLDCILVLEGFFREIPNNTTEPPYLLLAIITGK